MKKRIIGNNIIKLEKVNSTNEYAMNLIKTTNVEEGTVITTSSQLAGTGQGSNIWESEPGKNTTFFVLLPRHDGE